METDAFVHTQTSCYAVEFDDFTAEAESDFVIAPSSTAWLYFEDGLWHPFSDSSSSKLDSANSSHDEQCEVRIDDGVWIVDLKEMVARMSSSPRRFIPVQRTEDDNAPSPGISWVYLDASTRHWNRYRTVVSEVIEAAFIQCQPRINILELGDEWFSIIFKYNLALNKHGRYRHVRRCQADISWEVFLPGSRNMWVRLEGLALTAADVAFDSQEIKFDDGVLNTSNRYFLHSNGNRYGARTCWVNTKFVKEERVNRRSFKAKTSRHKMKEPSIIIEDRPLSYPVVESFLCHARDCGLRGGDSCKQDGEEASLPRLPPEEESKCDSFKMPPRSSPSDLKLTRRQESERAIPAEPLTYKDSFHVSPSNRRLKAVRAESMRDLPGEGSPRSEDSFHVYSHAASRGALLSPKASEATMTAAERAGSMRDLPGEESPRSVDSFHVYSHAASRGALLSPKASEATIKSTESEYCPPGLEHLLTLESSSSADDFKSPNRRPKAIQSKIAPHENLTKPLLPEATSLDDDRSPCRRHNTTRGLRAVISGGTAAGEEPQIPAVAQSAGSHKVHGKGIPWLQDTIPGTDEGMDRNCNTHQSRRVLGLEVSTTSDGWFTFPKSVWEAAPEDMRLQLLENAACQDSSSDEEDVDAEGSHVYCASLNSLRFAAIPRNGESAADENAVTSLSTNDDEESHGAHETPGHEEYEDPSGCNWEQDNDSQLTDGEGTSNGCPDDDETSSQGQSIEVSVEAPEGAQIYRESWSSARSVDSDKSSKRRSASSDLPFPRPSNTWAKVKPRIDANNLRHKPGGGNVIIPRKRIDWSNVKPRVDADNKEHIPGGGRVAIVNMPVKWNAKARVDHDNRKHRPGGGNVKIINEPTHWEAQPQVPRARLLFPHTSPQRISEDSESGSDSCRSAPPEHPQSYLQRIRDGPGETPPQSNSSEFVEKASNDA